jgi:hypothetical protein
MGRQFYEGMDEPFLLTCPKSDKAVWQHSRRRLSRASLRATVLKEGKGWPFVVSIITVLCICIFSGRYCFGHLYILGSIALMKRYDRYMKKKNHV